MREKIKKLLENLFKNKKQLILQEKSEANIDKELNNNQKIDINEGIKEFIQNFQQIYLKSGKQDEYRALCAINAHDNLKDKREIEKDKDTLEKELLKQKKESLANLRYTKDEYDMINLYIKLKKDNPKLATTFKGLPPIQIAFTTLGDDVETIQQEGWNKYYLNIKPKNIAKLASKYLQKQYINDQLYFKIRTTEDIQNNPHSDTFIIYAKEDQEQNIYSTIEEIYKESPELFEDARKK